MDRELLSCLACPLCDDRPPFQLENDTLICTKAGHRFSVIDGVPHLLPEDVIDDKEIVDGR